MTKETNQRTCNECVMHRECNFEEGKQSGLLNCNVRKTYVKSEEAQKCSWYRTEESVETGGIIC